MKYAQVPLDTFVTFPMGAGVLAVDFNLETAVMRRQDILGATDGGINFTDSIQFRDLAEGLDNVPRNTMELKKINNTEREITVSGTFRAANRDLVARLMAASSKSGNKITPLGYLSPSDFIDIWMIVDYSDVNVGDEAGYFVLLLKNVLHTGGFQMQTVNDDKAQFAFTFTAHFSIEDPDTVPYEVYIKEGGDPIPSIELNTHYETLVEGDTTTLIANTTHTSSTVTWSSSDTSVVTVSGGVVTAQGEGNAIVTAIITEGSVTFTDTCTIVVTEE